LDGSPNFNEFPEIMFYIPRKRKKPDVLTILSKIHMYQRGKELSDAESFMFKKL